MFLGRQSDERKRRPLSSSSSSSVWRCLVGTKARRRRRRRRRLFTSYSCYHSSPNLILFLFFPPPDINVCSLRQRIPQNVRRKQGRNKKKVNSRFFLWAIPSPWQCHEEDLPPTAIYLCAHSRKTVAAAGSLSTGICRFLFSPRIFAGKGIFFVFFSLLSLLGICMGKQSWEILGEEEEGEGISIPSHPSY